MTISGPDPAEPNRGNTIPGPRLPEAFDYAAMARSSKQLTSGRWIPSSVPSESEDCQRAAPRYIHLTPPSSVDSPSQSSMDNPSTHSEESKVGNEPALNIDQAPATVACESLEPELERGEVGEEETAEIDGGPDVVPTGASNDEEDPSEYNLQIEGSEYDEEDKDEEDNDQGAKLNDLVRRAPKRLKQYSNYVYLMEHRMHHVEKQIRRLQGREDQLTPSKEKSEDGKTPAISEIKYVQWADFKSTYAEKKEVYAIEALVGPARYWYQRRSDEWTRKWDTHDDQAAAVNTEIIVPDGLETDEQRREEIPERIRISSRPLLGILSNICSSELQKPHVFLRPYKLFIRHDSEIRNVYSKLEAKWAQEVSGHPANSQHRDATVIAPPATSDQPDANSISTGTAHDQGSLIAGQEGSNVADDTKPETDNSPPPTTKVDEESAEDSVGSLKAFKDLKCLIAFMDRHLAPVVEGFRSRSRRHIQFHELWYLFKSGDVVHAPRKIDPAQAKRKGAKSADQGRYQTFIRVFGVNGGQPNLRGDEHISEQSSLKDRVNPFGLDGYYVEYDGENYGLGSVCVYIQPFEGAREITSLEAYPLEYADNHADIYGDLKARGNKFREAVEQKHMFYLGSTYANNPNGTQFSEALSQFSEHISSEVIVDFAQALKLGLDELVFRAGLDWIVTQLPSASYPDQFSEDYPITVWKDGNQKDVHRYRDDTIFNDDIIDLRSFKHHADTDPFLKAVADLDMEIGNVGYENLRDDDIVVLPSRVIGYVLRERRWALLDVQKLRPIPPKADGFRELKLPRGHKDMVQALVRSHSMRREIDAATQDSADFDVVRGKGRGLIILLHGVPGVGKTSTAECIAESTGKPLFPITCGDLGLTPPDVEKNLRGIFQLAQAWDCVLLLDEADVFLAQRTKTDIKRNALVSGKSCGFGSRIKAHHGSLPPRPRVLHGHPILDDQSRRDL